MKAHPTGYILLSAVLPAFLLSACSEPPQKPVVPHEDILSQPQRLGDNSDFYHRFEGVAANGESIVLHVQKHGGAVSGAVVPQNGLPVILLQDSEDSLRRDSTFVFVAYDLFHKKSDATTNWMLQCHNASWTAQRTGDTGTAAFSLKESYPEGSLPLASITIADTVRYLPDRTDPQTRLSYTTVAAAGGNGGQLVNSTVRELLEVSGATELNKRSLSAALADRTHGYITAWYGDVRNTYDTADHEGAFAYNSSLDESINVLRNDGGWIVLRNMSAQYSGGAHANAESSYYSLDLKSGRAWSLNDIISDTLALQPLLDAAARETFGLRKGQALSKRLLVAAVPVTENVYVLKDGLALVYNPYEIAPYADGEIHLFLPWSQLRLLLTPAFRQRISGESRQIGGSA